jgi:molybdenum cofactor biosynthesis protein B
VSLQDSHKLDKHAIGVVVLTVNDGTSSSHDTNGKLIESLVHENGHEVVYRRVIKHTSAAVREAIAEALADEECEVIITTGGIGLSSRDTVHEILIKLYEKQIDFLGSLLCILGFSEKGPCCLLSRPSAGIIENHPVFSLPMDPTLIRIALEKLILPSLGNILVDAKR